MGRPVYIIPSATGGFADAHEKASRDSFVRVLAELTGGWPAGVLRAQAVPPEKAYFLPSDTLLQQRARELGIESADDLFGGVVPHPFVATKAISHGLVSEDAAAPEGWARSLADSLGDSVLPGFTAFTRDDAERAGRELLRSGPVRAKRVEAVAGRGQFVAEDVLSLVECLNQQDWDSIARTGLAIEQDLAKSTTYSVGQVQVGGAIATYYGLQKHTEDNAGEPTYGGSVLLVANGGFDALETLELSEPVRAAVEQARHYDRAVQQAYPDFFASRRNYDVIRGFTAGREVRSGVLEQSWRVGGASGAELVALLAFRDQPDLKSIKARTVEIFPTDAEVPPGALLLFRGEDPRVGPLTKYAFAEAP
jgi:hypothetical protein